ncbi:MAG: mannose-1-phosphate guanylyltransferase [Actinobacteria bacterium]|nr:mannose-1-phosphate guanylyltransferase [Actinomycetota bacterium]
MYAVVPAGGSGTRLWPLSRAAQPKFLHDLTGAGRTLIQATYARLLPLSAPERIYVVTGTAHAAGIARQLPDLPTQNVLVEPAPRDSAPAMGLAAAVIARRDPEAIMGSFASDHVVADETAFQASVSIAAQAAAAGYLMTIGITPTVPETGYGYLRVGAALPVAGAFSVEQFKEKPTREVAEGYLASGRYAWNASMFLWRVDAFLAELRRQQPVLHAGLTRIAADWGTERQDQTLGTVWPGLPKVTVEHGVMEDAAGRGRVGAVPGDFGWHDVGDWDGLGAVLPPSGADNIVLGERSAHVGVDTAHCVVVPAGGRLLATLGISGLVVVDTDDVVLVCSRERAQDVRELVAALRADGRDALV